MHLLATFFAMLLSFSQAASVRKATLEPQPSVSISASAMLPDEASDYAGETCLSCTKTNVSSSAR